MNNAKKCKNHKPAGNNHKLHHNHPEGACENCAYFSQANCRNHNAQATCI